MIATLSVMPAGTNVNMTAGSPWVGSDAASASPRSDRPAWHDDARCRTAPPNLNWFAETPTGVEAARRVCATCPVRQDCTEWSLVQGASLKGVWGGLTPRDRQQMRVARRKAA